MSIDPLNEALFQAIQVGDLTRTEALLVQGADVNATARLTLAAQGTLDTLTWIRLKLDAARGITPLRLAGWYGHTALARLLLERGADINAGERCASTPAAIMIAAEQQHSELTRLLLDRGADTNNGWSDDVALRHHISRGYTDLVRAMIDRGADLNARNDRGRTPLIWAAALSDEKHSGFDERHVDTVRLLLGRGADPNARNNYALTALMFAGRCVPVVRMLLEHGADASLKDHRGRTALRWARIRGRMEAVELLRQAGATE